MSCDKSSFTFLNDSTHGGGVMKSPQYIQPNNYITHDIINHNKNSKFLGSKSRIDRFEHSGYCTRLITTFVLVSDNERYYFQEWCFQDNQCGAAFQMHLEDTIAINRFNNKVNHSKYIPDEILEYNKDYEILGSKTKVNHDGFDCDGPQAELYTTYIIVRRNNTYQLQEWYGEERFCSTPFKMTLERTNEVDIVEM